MQSLRELQLSLGASLLDPGGGYADRHLRTNGIEAATRIGFYRDNVLANVREALRATYPVVDQLVGPDYFGRLAAEFFRAHPSTSGDLNLCGREFAAFLERHAVAGQLPYLPDVARLEWAVEQAFFAPDREPLDLARLAQVPPDRQHAITLVLHPSCRLIASRYPVQRIWALHQPAFDGPQQVDLAEGENRMLVHRTGYDVAVAPLDAGAYALLEALLRGCTLAEALAQAAPDQAFDATQFLQRHARSNLFVDFDWPL